MPKIMEQSENESPSEVHQAGPANGESKTTRKEVGGGRPGVNFASGLLENSNLKQPRKFVDFLIALAGQTAFVILLILLPLCYTQAFNPPEFERMMLIMPPPPPPPPLVREIVKPKASLFQNGKLFAPRTVPKHIEIVKEAPEETPGSAGVAGGVPGGVPGGTLGGVLGGILSPGNQPVPPPPPPRPVKSNRPLLVGGRVQAPRLIQKIQPVYPPLARETKTQGAVVLDCVIDKQGNVIQIKLVSGNPLLVQAAFAAVRQWKYQPTLLDGVPFAVEMRVTVTFTMAS
jgi:periplasmic protein TonB